MPLPRFAEASRPALFARIGTYAFAVLALLTLAIAGLAARINPLPAATAGSPIVPLSPSAWPFSR